jgi:hypothetical protein
MGIPVAIFYFFYLAFVLVFLVLSLFNIFHLIRYGVGFVRNLIAGFYIVMTIVIMLLSWGVISQINWNSQIPLEFNITPANPHILEL